MTAVQQWMRASNKPPAAHDPYWNSVILSLNGDSLIDLSNYAHVAAVSAGSSFESSVQHPVFGDSIRTNSENFGAWHYATAASEWRFNPVFTLDYSIYVHSDVGSNTILFLNSDFSQYIQLVGPLTISQQAQGKYGGAGNPISAVHQWHDVRLVSDGTFVAWYMDGELAGGLPMPNLADTIDRDFYVYKDPFGSSSLLDLSLAGIRYTNGVARNDPTDTTIPVPTAKWPTSL